MLQQWFRDVGIGHATCTTRPFSEWICCFKGVISFHLSQSEFDRIEDFLRSQLGVPTTDAKALDSLKGI